MSGLISRPCAVVLFFTALQLSAACAGEPNAMYDALETGARGEALTEAEQQKFDDEMYCRFFIHEDIRGTPEHVQALTGIAGHFWFSAVEGDIYFFSWRPETGVGLIFDPETHILEWEAIAGKVGFAPEVHYWECEPPSPPPRRNSER